MPRWRRRTAISICLLSSRCSTLGGSVSTGLLGPPPGTRTVRAARPAPGSCSLDSTPLSKISYPRRLKRVVFILPAAAIAALTVPLLASAGHPSRRHVSLRQEARIAAAADPQDPARGGHLQENRSFDLLARIWAQTSRDGRKPRAASLRTGSRSQDPRDPSTTSPTCAGGHGHGTAIATSLTDGHFTNQAEVGRTSYCKKHSTTPGARIPGQPTSWLPRLARSNYWEYARSFALQDHVRVGFVMSSSTVSGWFEVHDWRPDELSPRCRT